MQSVGMLDTHLARTRSRGPVVNRDIAESWTHGPLADGFYHTVSTSFLFLSKEAQHYCDYSIRRALALCLTKAAKVETVREWCIGSKASHS